MIYDTSKYSDKIRLEVLYTRLVKNNKVIELKERKPTRTNSQNRARWLYFTMVCDELNDRGETYFNSLLNVEMKFTPELLYQTFWKGVQGDMYPDKKKLDKKEFSQVAEVIIKAFAEGYYITIPFPSIDQL